MDTLDLTHKLYTNVLTMDDLQQYFDNLEDGNSIKKINLKNRFIEEGIYEKLVELILLKCPNIEIIDLSNNMITTISYEHIKTNNHYLSCFSKILILKNFRYLVIVGHNNIFEMLESLLDSLNTTILLEFTNAYKNNNYLLLNNKCLDIDECYSKIISISKQWHNSINTYNFLGHQQYYEEFPQDNF